MLYETLISLNDLNFYALQIITYSKFTIETVEKVIKYIQS